MRSKYRQNKGVADQVLNTPLHILVRLSYPSFAPSVGGWKNVYRNDHLKFEVS